MSRYRAQVSVVWVIHVKISVCPQSPKASMLYQGLVLPIHRISLGDVFRSRRCFALQPSCAPLTKTCIDKGVSGKSL